MFEKLGIKPQFTHYDQATSYERLRPASYRLRFTSRVRPVRAMSEFQADGRFHLLSVPFEAELAETYLPARFEASDYPRLIDSGKAIETIAVETFSRSSIGLRTRTATSACSASSKRSSRASRSSCSRGVTRNGRK